MSALLKTGKTALFEAVLFYFVKIILLAKHPPPAGQCALVCCTSAKRHLGLCRTYMFLCFYKGSDSIQL